MSCSHYIHTVTAHKTFDEGDIIATARWPVSLRCI